MCVIDIFTDYMSILSKGVVTVLTFPKITLYTLHIVINFLSYYIFRECRGNSLAVDDSVVAVF